MEPVHGLQGTRSDRAGAGPEHPVQDLVVDLDMKFRIGTSWRRDLALVESTWGKNNQEILGHESKLK